MPADTWSNHRARIHALWDELADFEVAANDEALRHLLGVMADLLSAENAYWLGALRVLEEDGDALRGWRPHAICYLHSSPDDDSFARRKIREIAHGHFDTSVAAHTRQAGQFRVRVLADLVPPEWFSSQQY